MLNKDFYSGGVFICMYSVPGLTLLMNRDFGLVPSYDS